MMKPRWHAAAPADVFRTLDSRPAGLHDAEAGRRLNRVGPNVFRPVRQASALTVLASQFRGVIVSLLAAATVVALLFGHAVDAAAIAVVLALNVGIGFVTELHARRAMESLLSLEVARALVRREGYLREIDASGLVPGDVIELEAGSVVPADARLITSCDLRTAEASLTGEAAPVEKRAEAPIPDDVPLADRLTMVYKTTAVVTGRATAVVVATGMRTEVGGIGQLAGSIHDASTPLERRLDELGRKLAGAALAVGAAVAGLGFLQGVPVAELLQSAIALAVAAVPEGLPVVGTIAMAIGMRRMARRHALIRRLPAVETLGSATVICTDKTGTLTAGVMSATVLRLLDREVTIPPTRAALAADDRVTQAFRTCILASSSDGVRGDPTELALIAAAQSAGLDAARLRAESPAVGEVPFSSERLLMAMFRRGADGTVAHVKGAPRRVVERCDYVLTQSGTRAIQNAEREELLELNRTLARRGLRVLALAIKPGAEVASDVRGLTWIGFVGLSDPPASGVSEHIHAFRMAGIRVVMLTGDQRHTAESVARDLGLLDGRGRVVDGRELGMSDRELEAAVEATSVFSRVSPEDKLRIVSAHQRRGEIVAMLGDGVNDAAALRQADIGVAMGIRGTDLAKEAADVILQDDRFGTVTAAIEEGRVIFDNIRKFVFYLFSCNFAEIVLILGAALAGLPAPLVPLQILWLNLLTDTFPALALAAEPPGHDLMRQPPRSPTSGIVSRAMVRSILGYGSLIAFSSLLAFWWGLAAEVGADSAARGRTMAFMTIALGQITHLGNARSDKPVTSIAAATSNRLALAAVALAVALQGLAAGVPPLARLLEVTPLSASDWLVVVALGSLPGALGQLLTHRRNSRRDPRRRAPAAAPHPADGRLQFSRDGS